MKKNKKKFDPEKLERAADNIVAQVKKGDFWITDYRDKLNKHHRVSPNTIRKIIEDNIKLTGNTITEDLVNQLLPYVMRSYKGSILKVLQSDEVDAALSSRTIEREKHFQNNRRVRKESAPLAVRDINWIEKENSKSLGKAYKVLSQSTVKLPPLRKKDRKSTPR
jgi:hypothetical protein